MMEQYDLDQEIGTSTTIKHTIRDLVDAVALLTNAYVIDMDECRRLADKIDSTYPTLSAGSSRRRMQAARPGDIGCPGLDDFHPSDRTATVYDYRALVRRLVEIADNPSATERLVDYDRVARAHEPNIKEED